MITVSLPIVILDLAAVVFWLPWGYQLTITCIETLIIEALLLVWIALEHCRYLRASLGGDAALWEAFRAAYFRAARGGRAAEIVVRGLSRVIRWQRRLRGRGGG